MRKLDPAAAHAHAHPEDTQVRDAAQEVPLQAAGGLTRQSGLRA